MEFKKRVEENAVYVVLGAIVVGAVAGGGLILFLDDRYRVAPLERDKAQLAAELAKAQEAVNPTTSKPPLDPPAKLGATTVPASQPHTLGTWFDSLATRLAADGSRPYVLRVETEALPDPVKRCKLRVTSLPGASFTAAYAFQQISCSNDAGFRPLSLVYQNNQSACEIFVPETQVKSSLVLLVGVSGVPPTIVNADLEKLISLKVVP